MTAAFTQFTTGRAPGRALGRAAAVLLLGFSSVLGAQQPTSSSATTAAATAAVAPARPLSLDEAIRLAARESEELQIARAGVARAGGQVKQARSLSLPQLNASLAYARTLRSQFSALAGGAATDTASAPQLDAVCAPNIPAGATQAQRDAALAQAQTCANVVGIDFTKVGFGAKNQYTLGLAFSQSVFSGGRNSGQQAAASAGRRVAEVELTSQRAQLALDVTQAYFDAALADRLVEIADTTLAQTNELLRQTTLARRVGNTSEFDLLRATVTRDNQRPVVIQRRGDRDIAYLRLKQLLNLPLEEPVQLTTPIDEPATVSRVIAANAANVPLVSADSMAPLPTADTATANRAPVRESEENVRAQEGLLRVARADRLPSLAITSNYQRLFFPNNFAPNLSQFSENWTIGGSLGMSLFSGGRVTGQIEVARANLDEARARRDLSRELAALDTRVALNQLAQAEAAFAASHGTAGQARRAYSIDQIRYREGISTQTDLTQSRLLLEQAVANQAFSARDLAVARARLALIRDLPINTAALGAAAQRATLQQQQPQQQQQQPTLSQQQSAQSAAPGTSGAGQIGSTTP
jgi:outer membrane protein TolC